ncbi:MAG: glutamyl-tRNA reductase [Opitutales bacterium]|nr:glutamyl-tRNA reductase [Opitutales bacterium]MCH8540496.1 glutamyl-tRNA reductase [Opitutales bacterium]
MLAENAINNAPDNLFLYGATHREVPLNLREKLAFTEERLIDFYRKTRGHPHLGELLLLNTCNRMEIYGVAPQSALFSKEILRGSLSAILSLPRETLDQCLQFSMGKPVVEHLFNVASGIDSLVVGEAEILGQVKAAYATARTEDTIGPLLNRTFQKSFQAAKWVRTHTDIGKGQVSVGSVAVELAGHVFGDLADCRILIIGAGEIAERTLTSLQGRGVTNVTIANRTYSKACEAARIFHGRATPLEDIETAVREADIIIGSTAAPEPILTAPKLKSLLAKRPLQPLFLIDLSVPRNFDQNCENLSNVYLYNIDDLGTLARDNLKARHKEIEACRKSLELRATHLWERLGSQIKSSKF